MTTTYGYDALNRNSSISYSDGTPTVGRVYDGAIPNGTGRLYYNYTWSANDSTKTYTRIDAYDASGRVKDLKQHFWLNGNWTTPYAMTANYDLAGHETSTTYPSNRSVNYSYDGAGRTNSFTGNLGEGGASRNYSTGISYSPFGGMSQEQLGTTTPIYNKLLYNSRGQLAEIREGVNPNDTGWERGAIINHYSNGYGCWGASCNAADNNGNLMKQDIYIPGSDHLTTDWFAYDSLNRLQSATETDFIYSTQQTNTQWAQAYNYDRYGNRTLNQGSTWGTGIPNPYFGVDQSTNRLTPAGGYTMHYDAAGNLDNDNYTGGGTRVYDAENRMTQADNGADVYTYDADGRRVKRKIGATETWQIYGIGGELLAEYSSSGALQKEYGYRNGQLLITATVNSGGWGAPPSFDDNPLVIGQTPIRSAHITQLRTAIDAVRSHFNLGNYLWQALAAPGDPISIAPIQEMRTALDQALGAPPAPGYVGGVDHNLPILAAHIQELRTRVLNNWQSGGGGVDLRWLVSDQLGTPRMIFDQSGSLSTVSRHDYLPFGEELTTQGGRTPGLGYGGDTTRQKFTSKERDDETGLDYFGARYYGSTQGRFTSPDPLLSSGRLTEPASWNRYSYTLNNPLKFIDPSGLYEYEAGATNDQKRRFEAQMKAATQTLNKIAKKYGANSDEYKNAKRGLDAYGDPNKANGVIVAFGATSSGKPGETSGGTDIGGKVKVTIDIDNIKDDGNLGTIIGHEGSHAQDRADFRNAFTAAFGSDPNDAKGSLTALFNGAMTCNASETTAYGVSSVLGEFLLKNETAPQSGGGVFVMSNKTYVQQDLSLAGTKIWDPAWAKVDVATVRANRSAAIATGLKNDSYYSANCGNRKIIE